MIFTPLDFPDLDEIEYRKFKPMLWEIDAPVPIAVFSEILRSTLPYWKRRRFDRLPAIEVITLVESYLDMNATKAEVLDELRIKRDTGNSSPEGD